jgi:hypothetical protein
VEALGRLPLREDLDPADLDALVREQAGRIWFAWVMGAGNEAMRRDIRPAKAEIRAMMTGRATVLSRTALDAVVRAEGDPERALEVLEEWQAATGRYRPQAQRARWVVRQAAGVYHTLTGKAAPRTRDPKSDGRAVGPLVSLVADLFAALGLTRAIPARHVQTYIDETVFRED